MSEVYLETYQTSLMKLFSESLGKNYTWQGKSGKSGKVGINFFLSLVRKSQGNGFTEV